MKITIPLREAPEVISDSVKTSLVPHGFLICDHQGRPLDEAQLVRLYNELGRNVAQSLVALDVTGDEQP